VYKRLLMSFFTAEEVVSEEGSMDLEMGESDEE
jgi:hypothetical protein